MVGYLDHQPQPKKISSQRRDMHQIELLVAQRNEARALGDYERADQIREELRRMGIEVIDSSAGTKWEYRSVIEQRREQKKDDKKFEGWLNTTRARGEGFGRRR